MDILLTKRPSEIDLEFLFQNRMQVRFFESWEDVVGLPGSVIPVIINSGDGDFMVGLGFAKVSEMWLLETARTLSARLKCKTWYGGLPFAMQPVFAPYACVVFDCGLAYLGDDFNLEQKGTIKFIKRLPELDFGTELAPE